MHVGNRVVPALARARVRTPEIALVAISVTVVVTIVVFVAVRVTPFPIRTRPMLFAVMDIAIAPLGVIVLVSEAPGAGAGLAARGAAHGAVPRHVRVVGGPVSAGSAGLGVREMPLILTWVVVIVAVSVKHAFVTPFLIWTRASWFRFRRRWLPNPLT